MQAIGLLGGTFDPIHLGHLRLAEELAEALGLERVRFLPTGTPPHRGQPAASAGARSAMTALAITGNPRFILDEYESRKAEPCYMVDTLSALRLKIGHDTPVVLFLGTDAFAGLTGWHEWLSLFDLAHLAIAHRPGFSLTNWAAQLAPELRLELEARQTDFTADLHATPAGRIWWHPITQLDISATQIRDLIRAGRSPRYLVPDTVLDYIEQQHLYL